MSDYYFTNGKTYELVMIPAGDGLSVPCTGCAFYKGPTEDCRDAPCATQDSSVSTGQFREVHID